MGGKVLLPPIRGKEMDYREGGVNTHLYPGEVLGYGPSVLGLERESRSSWEKGSARDLNVIIPPHSVR